MKSYQVHEFRTMIGVDYRLVTGFDDRNRRHTSAYVGDMVGESKADTVKKLQIALRLTVNSLLADRTK